MKISQILASLLTLISLCLPGCHNHEDHSEGGHHKIVVTCPYAKDVIITQQYVCQIHSQRHIKVKALQAGYLEPILVKEGQAVRKGEVLFQVIPILYKAKLDAELAEVQLAELELKNTQSLFNRDPPVVSRNEVALYEAKLARAKAKAEQAKAEFNFTKVTAPFDGIIDRQEEQHGSLLKEGDVLTTLSDNSLMWVYFNVPEARYLQYMAEILGENFKKLDYQSRLKVFLAEMNRQSRIELVLADGSKFPQIGTLGTIEARFNNENGNIAFRADFANPERLLRHGMTGNVLLHRTQKNAIVIPQRATFEILDKQYVFVVGNDGVVHQREILVQNEQQDTFVIKKGLRVEDKIVYEGVRQVRDGEKVEAEYRPPEQVLSKQQYPAE